jgi:hypothetical protein
MGFVTELALIAFPFVVFFIVQISIKKHEVLLAFVTLGMIVYSFLLSYRPGEFALLLFGLILGLFIEVGLGLIIRTQHWKYASFFGVPYWLPLMWGYGFVVIHRLGELILSRF